MGAFEKYMKGAAQKNLAEKDTALKTIESSFAQAMKKSLGRYPERAHHWEWRNENRSRQLAR